MRKTEMYENLGKLLLKNKCLTSQPTTLIDVA